MKNRKMFLVAAICLSLLFLLFSAPYQAEALQSKKPVKVGFMYAMTGMFAPMGKDVVNGIKEWLEVINNEAGGISGHPIEYVMADTQSDATKATLAVKKLINIEKVHLIAGCNSTGVALSVAPVCEENGIPLVTATASEVFEYKLKPKWSFRGAMTAWEQVDWGLALVKKFDPKNEKIAVLYQAGAWGKSLYDMANYYAPKRGLKIVAYEKFDPRGHEFGAQISKLIASNPDVMVVYCAGMAGPLAMKQMREMGMNKIIISNSGLNMKAVREAFKDTFSIPPSVYASGTKADVWKQLPKNSEEYKLIAPIAGRYEKKYGHPYGWFQHMGVNGMYIIKDALERAFRENHDLLDCDLERIRSEIRDKIETTQNLNIGAGIITMSQTDHCGQLPGSSLATYHWEKGKLIYDPHLSDIVNLAAPPRPE